MRKQISLLLLLIVAAGFALCLAGAPFGAEGARESRRLVKDNVNYGRRYVSKGLDENRCANIVTSVVLNYRGFDTLGEVTILFIAALGLGAVLYGRRAGASPAEAQRPSLILSTGCRLLFPLIMLVGIYIFIHGHLSPGGGFQGGAVIASGFLLICLGCRKKKLNSVALGAAESLSGLAFVLLALIGLAVGGSFLLNFLPTGKVYALFSGGIIPLIYIAIGVKVGSELSGIIDNLSGEVR